MSVLTPEHQELKWKCFFFNPSGKQICSTCWPHLLLSNKANKTHLQISCTQIVQSLCVSKVSNNKKKVTWIEFHNLVHRWCTTPQLPLWFFCFFLWLIEHHANRIVHTEHQHWLCCATEHFLFSYTHHHSDCNNNVTTFPCYHLAPCSRSRHISYPSFCEMFY